MEPLDITIEDSLSRSQRILAHDDAHNGSQRDGSPHRKPSVTLSEIMENIQESQAGFLTILGFTQ
jgi:hypothetical protein